MALTYTKSESIPEWESESTPEGRSLSRSRLKTHRLRSPGGRDVQPVVPRGGTVTPPLPRSSPPPEVGSPPPFPRRKPRPLSLGPGPGPPSTYHPTPGEPRISHDRVITAWLRELFRLRLRISANDTWRLHSLESWQTSVPIHIIQCYEYAVLGGYTIGDTLTAHSILQEWKLTPSSAFSSCLSPHRHLSPARPAPRQRGPPLPRSVQCPHLMTRKFNALWLIDICEFWLKGVNIYIFHVSTSNRCDFSLLACINKCTRVQNRQGSY